MDKTGIIYDSVIVGTGLSAVSASYELKDKKILLLDKNDYSGGKVFTKEYEGISYELGALFAYIKECIPFNFESSALIEEKGKVGLWYKGRICYADSGEECMCKAGFTPKQLSNFFTDNENVSNDLHQVLNVFFRVIHPGNIEDAVTERQKDALIRFDTDHYEKGNRELIDAYLGNLMSGSVKNNAEVIEVEDKENIVKIIYRHKGEMEQVYGKTCLVSAEAPIARSIIKKINADADRFLSSVSYGGGTVVALGIHGIEFDDFSYIVNTGIPLNTIFKFQTKKDDFHVLTAYYVAEESKKLSDMSGTDILNKTVAWLEKVHPYQGTLSHDKIAFSEIYPWRMVGPVISGETYRLWTPECMRPSGRVFLCGDYQYVNAEDLMPYGMNPAIFSGRNAGNEIKKFLETDCR